MDLNVDALIERISNVKSRKELEDVRVESLGKKGALSDAIMAMKNASPQDKASLGKKINEMKQRINRAIEAKRTDIDEIEMSARIEQGAIDVTVPGRGFKNAILGKEHVISQTIRELRNIVNLLGFKVVQGPEMEDEWHNFDALNMDVSHPARQHHDTFYLDIPAKSPNNRFLLRTHTSSVQIRYMTDNAGPQRIASIGKVYRADYDATHTPMFHQIEILCIDRDISLANLRQCISDILSMYFNISNIKMRIRSSYFPFTEPSMEIDIHTYVNDEGKLSISSDDTSGRDNQGRWIEILGAGMVHRNVLDNMKVDMNQYRGFAMGMGIERVAMLKHGITDLRSLYGFDCF